MLIDLTPMFPGDFQPYAWEYTGRNGRRIITNGYAPDRPLNQPRLLSISPFTGYEHTYYSYYYRPRTTCVVRW